MSDTSIKVSDHNVGQARAFVVPPITPVTDVSGNTVTWQNNTAANARLWFPNGDQLFDPAQSNPALAGADFSDPIDIPAGSSQTLTLKNQPKHGFYKYTVYCESVKGHAQGNSEPILGVP